MTMMNESKVTSFLSPVMVHLSYNNNYNCNNNNYNSNNVDGKTLSERFFSFVLEKHYYSTVSGIKLE